MFIKRGLNGLGKKKSNFLLQSASKVNRNNVKLLKNFWGPKMHCPNIADERYFQKRNYFYFFVL